MIIRRLTPEERFEGEKIAHIAFHVRRENPEAMRGDCMKDTTEAWGAFAEDGTLAARMLKPEYTVNINGHALRMGGIGGVSTLPEYRESGAIRAIFASLLPAARQAGDVVSGLFPFNHAFYRKVGYETVCYRDDYEMPSAALRPYAFAGKAERWLPGKPVDGYAEVYRAFSSQFNLTGERTPEVLSERYVRGDNIADGRFCYLLAQGEENLAYVIYRDVRREPAAMLTVEDCAWKDARGFRAILGFLSRFTADYGRILLPLPVGVELHNLIRTPAAYEVQKTTRRDYMLRVVNTEKLLAALPMPRGASCVIGVEGDELIPENNGAWRVMRDDGQTTVTPAGSETPALTVSSRALAQLAVGAIDLDEALLRGDTRLSPGADKETLDLIFARRKILATEHF